MNLSVSPSHTLYEKLEVLTVISVVYVYWLDIFGGFEESSFVPLF